MKATIHGVAVEGTPQEIMEYQQMMEVKVEGKPKSPSIDTDWMQKGMPKITSGGTTVKRCTGPCYCTGACEGRPTLELQRKWINDCNNVSADRFKDAICMNATL